MKSDDDIRSSCHSASEICLSNASFGTTSNHPVPHESSSMFGDTSCGEPLHPQHLILDFTPIEELDNDVVQRKCCAFWDFLNSRNDLHELMARPEKNSHNLGNLSSLETTFRQDGAPERFKETTAVSMLEFVEEKGLIDRTFEAKLPMTTCSLGSREYRENEINSRYKATTAGKEVCKSVCKCRGVCKSQSTPSTATPEVQLMCSKMQEWDANHPKSLNPPGHPPALSHCIMQRKVAM